MQKKGPSLYELLQKYGKSDYAAFHMPGHKRQVKSSALPKGLPWEIDITEIDGFDDLHHAEGILRESMENAAAFYGVKKTFYSINGSTAGILSAVFAAAKPGDTILMGRNCHKSVYHAVLLRELRPLYLYPQIDKETGLDCGYNTAELEKMLTKHPEIKAVILTSPTYEGVISDIRTLAELVHQKKIPLIVDEAHGAHLTVKGQLETNKAREEQPAVNVKDHPLGDSAREDFPRSAVLLGADLVIQSLHKTLPSLTQTAVLHVCERAAEALCEEATRYMSIFQTSSPSYVLLASIDACLRYMDCAKGRQRRRRYALRLETLRGRLKKLCRIRLLEPGAWDTKTGPAADRGPQNTWQDPSKLILAADGCTGKELYDWLREEYHIQPEMCTCEYVLLITSLFDTDEMYERLYRALKEMDAVLQNSHRQTHGRQKWLRPAPANARLTPSQADRRPRCKRDLWESEGFVSAEYVYLYPPGIPLLAPGEQIRETELSYLKKARENGLELRGLQDAKGEHIQVIQTQESESAEGDI